MLPPSHKKLPNNYTLQTSGLQIWKMDRILDFDLTDPNNYFYPATQEYNSLFDDHLRGYLASSHVTKLLRRQGFITRDGHVFCSLRDYNRYRVYLHQLNVRIVKQHNVRDVVVGRSFTR